MCLEGILRGGKLAKSSFHSPGFFVTWEVLTFNKNGGGADDVSKSSWWPSNRWFLPLSSQGSPKIECWADFDDSLNQRRGRENNRFKPPYSLNRPYTLFLEIDHLSKGNWRRQSSWIFGFDWQKVGNFFQFNFYNDNYFLLKKFRIFWTVFRPGSVMEQLVNLLNLGRALKRSEPVPPAFEWIDEKFQSLSINGHLVSLQSIKRSYDLIFKEASILIQELTLTTPNDLTNLFEEIKRKEDRSNFLHGFSPFLNKGGETLKRFAQNSLIGKLFHNLFPSSSKFLQKHWILNSCFFLDWIQNRWVIWCTAKKMEASLFEKIPPAPLSPSLSHSIELWTTFANEWGDENLFLKLQWNYSKSISIQRFISYLLILSFSDSRMKEGMK